MPTTVVPNTYYTSNRVSNKYNPFNPMELWLAQGDKALYSKMLTHRSALLKKMSVLPQALRLMTSNWAKAERAEVGKKPPLVVVSSNRSGWIKKGIAAAAAELDKLRIANFTNVNDFRALKGTAGQKVSPPIYCPKRLGAPLQRSIYIVVHSSEYNNYKTALDGSGINVIGWDFVKPKDQQPFVGFGATRFAAVEFCKTLRQNVADLGNVWDYAWLLDDNVVALQGFAGLEKAEAALPANKVCAGFHGADAAYTNGKVKWLAGRLLRPPDNMPVSVDKGILQQVGLWNIKYLTENRLNFPPTYITSAEDISLNRYFNLKGIGYNYYNEIYVTKELVTAHDGSGGDVNASRQHYASLFAKKESGIPVVNPVPPPPPPFKVVCEAKETSIVDFVSTKLLATKPETVQHVAACQGIEQITKTAISRGTNFIEDDALTATFKLNGDAAQPVELYNVK